MQSSFLRQQTAIVPLVIFRAHAVVGAIALEALGIFLTQERILHIIGDCAAAFGNIHRGIVGVLLAGRARFTAGIVRPEPGSEAERLFRRAEMLMIPARAAGRRRNHPELLIINTLDLIALAVLPRRDAEVL